MIEKKYRITVDKTKLVQKPEREEIDRIYSRLINAEETTIPDFIELIHSGYTWSGGIFEGSMNNFNWRSQSIFGLDFDNKKTIITPELVISRFKKFNIIPQVIHETFTSTKDLMKFSVVLFLDHEISKKEDFNFLSKGMKLIFPEADNRCFSMTAFFFAGNNPKLLSNKPIKLENLFHMISSRYITSYDRSRELKSLLSESSFIDYSINAEMRELLYYNNYKNSPISAKKNEKEKIEKINWDVARSRIKILDQFFGGYWLDHMSLFYLATNMINIKGGIKKMKDIMIENNEAGRTEYTENNFSIFSYIKFLQYPSIPISYFSPFPEDAELYDMLDEIQDRRGKIEILEKPVRISLIEAQEKFDQEFKKVMEEGETGKIYIFKLPTALGKSKKLTNLEDVTIALPTNKLKDEIAQRMDVVNTKSPEPIEFQNNVNKKKYHSIYTNGIPEEGIEFVKKIFKENSEDSIEASRYLQETNDLMFSKNSLVITHERAIKNDFQHSTLIFDEDPIDKILEINQMFISDLQVLISRLRLPGNQDLNNLLENLESSEPNVVIKTPDLTSYIDQVKEQIKNFNIPLSNIPMFLSSSYYIKDSMDKGKIYYIKKNDLSTTKKIIILSATITPIFYQHLYGDRVHVFDLGEVENTGKVLQYTRRSCSRNSLSKYVTKLAEEVGESIVITFKDYSKYFQNGQEDIYFGNCSGYDTLANKNLTVVGTPHLKNTKYFLFANILGINYTNDDTKMSYQWIEHNGFRFKFNTFFHEGLRIIQLFLIESEIIQAVGRARTLRYNCTVSLYSNFPLKQSSEFIF